MNGQKGQTDMDRKMLNQYIDACELIKETEEEILHLESMQSKMVQDSVRGSNPDFPYEPRRFKIEGAIIRDSESIRLARTRRLLEKRRKQAEDIKAAVEEQMITLPLRMQRIIRYHFFQGLTWGETASRMGRRATAGSVRKEFENYFRKK